MQGGVAAGGFLRLAGQMFQRGAAGDAHAQQGDAGRAHGEQAGQTFGIVTVVVQLGAGDDGDAALQPVRMQAGQDEAGALGGQQDVGPAQEGSLGRQQTQLDGPAGGTGTQAVGDVGCRQRKERRAGRERQRVLPGAANVRGRLPGQPCGRA